MTTNDVNRFKHQIKTQEAWRNDSLLAEVEAAIKWMEGVAEDRSATNRVDLFVNDFYQWSRQNPPKIVERTYMSTPEVMELQWSRWLKNLILTTGQITRETPEQGCLPSTTEAD